MALSAAESGRKFGLEKARPVLPPRVIKSIPAPIEDLGIPGEVVASSEAVPYSDTIVVVTDVTLKKTPFDPEELAPRRTIDVVRESLAKLKRRIY